MQDTALNIAGYKQGLCNDSLVIPDVNKNDDIQGGRLTRLAGES